MIWHWTWVLSPLSRLLEKVSGWMGSSCAWPHTSSVSRSRGFAWALSGAALFHNSKCHHKLLCLWLMNSHILVGWRWNPTQDTAQCHHWRALSLAAERSLCLWPHNPLAWNFAFSALAAEKTICIKSWLSVGWLHCRLTWWSRESPLLVDIFNVQT